MQGLINRTKSYSALEPIDETSILARWEVLVSKSRIAWKTYSQAQIFEAEPLDEGEELEHRMIELQVNDDDDDDVAGEEDVDNDGEPDEDDNDELDVD